MDAIIAVILTLIGSFFMLRYVHLESYSKGYKDGSSGEKYDP
jgi:hypothetical protein